MKIIEEYDYKSFSELEEKADMCQELLNLMIFEAERNVTGSYDYNQSAVKRYRMIINDILKQFEEE